MNETTTTETTASERWRAEQAHVQTPEGAREAVARERANLAAQVERNLRERWGGDESGYQRGLAAVDLARERYGVTPDAVRAQMGLSPEEANDFVRNLGEEAAVTDAAITPAEAREILAELGSDAGFMERHKAGDRLARKRWAGLQNVIGYGRR